jgi:SH3-like domain-containing protein
VKLLTASTPTSPEVVNLDVHTLLKVEAATAGWYRVSLPNGQKGFVAGSNVSAVSLPLRNATVKNKEPLLDNPNNLAAKKTTLVPDEPVNIIAAYKDFYYVKNNKEEEGWVSKKAL